MKKQSLIDLMNMLEFNVADIKVDGTKELVGHKESDGRITYLSIRKEEAAFVKLFQGSIRKACLN